MPDSNDDFSEAAKVYSALGGMTSMGCNLVNSGINIAQGLAEGKIPFTGQASLGIGVVGLACSIPLESDDAQEMLDSLVFGIDIVSVIADSAQLLSPAKTGGVVEEGLAGSVSIMQGSIDLVLDTISFGLEMYDGDDVGWDITKYAQNVLSSISNVSGGVGDISVDPVVEYPAMILSGFAGLVVFGIGIARAVDAIAESKVFQKH